MTAEQKLRLLVGQDAGMLVIFGPAPLRWFSRQLQPGYIDTGTCARVLRVSTARMYTHEGLNAMSEPRIQIDVMDYDSVKAAAAADAVIAFMETVNLATDEMFASPPTVPAAHPNFLLNQRQGMEPRTSKGSVFVETLDYRIFNLEN